MHVCKEKALLALNQVEVSLGIIIKMKSFTFRTDADVERILGFAKLERGDFLATVQCLSFEAQLDNESVQLMEVDKVILDHLKAGDRYGPSFTSVSACLNIAIPGKKYLAS